MREGEPCKHKGCLSHISHPCEECGRIGGKIVNNQVVFECRKCEFLIYIEEITKEKLQEIMNLECPNCGEDCGGNWSLLRMGNYEAEY